MGPLHNCPSEAKQQREEIIHTRTADSRQDPEHRQDQEQKVQQ